MEGRGLGGDESPGFPLSFLCYHPGGGGWGTGDSQAQLPIQPPLLGVVGGLGLQFLSMVFG